MANTAQAKKRVRQAENHRQHNASMRSMLRTYVKRVIKAIQVGDKAKAESEYRTAVPVLDRHGYLRVSCGSGPCAPDTMPRPGHSGLGQVTVVS